MAMIGTGTTIAFTNSSHGDFFAEILDISPPNASREAIQTSHMGTTNAHTFVPADLTDWGELNCEIAFDPRDTPPIGVAADTITITFPNSAASTWAFTGFMTSYEPSVPLEDRATANVTIKVTGQVTITP